jgi:hypothetical protein
MTPRAPGSLRPSHPAERAREGANRTKASSSGEGWLGGTGTVNRDVGRAQAEISMNF